MRFAAQFLTTAVCLSVGSQSMAAFPFIENFTNGTANWKENTDTADVTYSATGSFDGGAYVTDTHTLPVYATPQPPNYIPVAPAIFRAKSTSSGGGFTGNWLTAGIKEVTAYVRHNAPAALVFNGRFAAPGGVAGNPGASYAGQSVDPNVWTKITFDVTPTSTQNLSYGGGAHSTVFDDIGHMQFSAVVPPSFTTPTEVKFDLDRVTVAVPEPATVGLAGLGLAAWMFARRRRRSAAC